MGWNLLLHWNFGFQVSDKKYGYKAEHTLALFLPFDT